MESANPVLAEVWRGELVESIHRGTAVVCAPSGEVIEAWGEPDRVILPRSACKMIQALPLIESGAADAAGLGAEHLALACASHAGTDLHTGLARRWLAGLGLGEGDLRCGAHPPNDPEARYALRLRGERPGQFHNNCSGKHCGFLTVTRQIGGGPDYIDPDHPVQRAVRQAIEEVTGAPVAGRVIDGCSAPNYGVPIGALAAAMARFATARRSFTGARAAAAERLVEAMAAHPELVAGAGRPTTGMIRACRGRAVAKSGAEGVFTAMLTARGLGIALKIDDGSERGSVAAMAALLARYGALKRDDPVYGALADAPILNARGTPHGHFRAADALTAPRP